MTEKPAASRCTVGITTGDCSDQFTLQSASLARLAFKLFICRTCHYEWHTTQSLNWLCYRTEFYKRKGEPFYFTKFAGWAKLILCPAQAIIQASLCVVRLASPYFLPTASGWEANTTPCPNQSTGRYCFHTNSSMSTCPSGWPGLHMLLCILEILQNVPLDL